MKKEKKHPEFISKKTKRGILLLVFVCLCMVYTPRVISLFQDNEELVLSEDELVKIEELKKEYVKKKKAKRSKTYQKKEFKVPPSKFDPNEYSKEQWMYLGLSEKQADVMLKISKRGIWTNEFLGNITVLPNEVFELIKDSTFYPQKEYPKNDYANKYPQKKKEEQKIIEINSASQADLVSLPGIGPTYSLRIIAYKELLGGFLSKEQLKEVYGITQENYELFSPFVSIDASLIKKLNVNEASLEQLKKHPYLNYSIANSIFQMRRQKEGFKKIEELKESKLINPELFEKLKPYVYL